MNKRILRIITINLTCILGIVIVFTAVRLIPFYGTNVYNVVMEDSQKARDSDENITIDKSEPGKTENTFPDQVNPGGTLQSSLINNTMESITIAAVGDIMCHDSNLRSAYDSVNNIYNFKDVFEYVKPYISSADLAIANLETVTAGEKTGYSSYPLFNTPDAILEALSFAGVDILTTANNHCLDRGRQGLERTIKMIEKNNMLHTGTNLEMDDKRFIRFVIKGFTLSILAYTYGCNGNIVKLDEDERKYMVNLIDEAKIMNDIETARQEGSDVIIVCMHWGVEYEREPVEYQTKLAERIFDWGADIIFGSHPHVIQESRIDTISGRDRYVIYSMGNFVSNFRREDKSKRKNKVYTEDGLIVLVELERVRNSVQREVKINKVTHIPTWMDKYMENGFVTFKVLPIPDFESEAVYINDRNYEKVKASYINTMELMLVDE